MFFWAAVKKFWKYIQVALYYMILENIASAANGLNTVYWRPYNNIQRHILAAVNHSGWIEVFSAVVVATNCSDPSTFLKNSSQPLRKVAIEPLAAEILFRIIHLAAMNWQRPKKDFEISVGPPRKLRLNCHAIAVAICNFWISISVALLAAIQNTLAAVSTAALKRRAKNPLSNKNWGPFFPFSGKIP